MITLLVLFLVLLLIGALPVFPYSRGWGYIPAGLVAVILAVVGVSLLI